MTLYGGIVMTYSNLIEPISPKESPAEIPDASVDGDDNTDGDIKQIVETGSVTVSKDGSLYSLPYCDRAD